MLSLANDLKKEKQFGYARKILGRARSANVADPKLRCKLRQQHALCTYKDPDLPAGSRFDLALEILQEFEDLSETRDQETLGLAGAILKRKWEFDAQKENLERSLSYYLRGYSLDPKNDQGYTGINAAFVLDQLAGIEAAEARRTGAQSAIAQERQRKAREIRENLAAVLPGLPAVPATSWLEKEWWFYATVIEAFFGLGRYDKALEWVEKGQAKVAELPAWERQSTAMQLAALARMQFPSPGEFGQSPAARVLARVLGELDDSPGPLTAYVGKVGLALSGGGFRASLFHIGVLAKLAELDVLRHVEVLSCVSGGSILGAHYYLELRRLFKENQDSKIDRDRYIECVKTVAAAFLLGVRQNIRTRIAAEFITNLKMIFLPGYSRTMRAGDLYERFLYALVEDGQLAKPKWWAPWRRYQRWMTDLYIIPKDADENFRPKADNWCRNAKVPELILNATCLNTGHNWQFTASWMGEPPGNINTEVDGNYRLRRMYYWEAPEEYRQFRLGRAVAASACVPGLFEPLSLPRLYPGLTVRLVDGGVHDNQGIAGLLEQDCSVLLVSDASGQMETQDDPSQNALGVPLRSNSILMSRVRANQHDDLVARSRSRLLRGLMFIHLKKDLDVDPVDWVDCEDPAEASDLSRPASRRGVLTRYGIRKDLQRLLAGIRTDLDSFSEAEAFALMTSGYRMTEQAFRDEESLKSFPAVRDKTANWDFLRIESAMQNVSQAKKVMKRLDVARMLSFKIWRLLLPLRILGWVVLSCVAAALVWLAYTYWNTPILWVSTAGTGLATLVAGWLFGKWVVRITRYRDSLMKIGIGVGLALLGPLLVRLHLWVFDRLFLWYGTVERVLGSDAKKRSP
jgi:predicted acylesterase/phospholipase RssA